MRKHLIHIFTPVFLSVLLFVSGIQALAMEPETEPVVDTIELSHDLLWDTGVPVDLSWKTKNDKGQWIDELGIVGDSNGLILVINNLDREDMELLPLQEDESGRPAAKDRFSNGKSRLMYFSKGMDDEWHEVFSAECFISGGELEQKEEIYGIYEPESAFGRLEDPGSLIPYHSLTSEDYWVLDPESEEFGQIYTAETLADKPQSGFRLESMKTFANYGLILKPETEDGAYPALIVSCQQSEKNYHALPGFQLPETYLRMLVQSIDEDTKIVIVGDLEDLADMSESEYDE